MIMAENFLPMPDTTVQVRAVECGIHKLHSRMARVILEVISVSSFFWSYSKLNDSKELDENACEQQIKLHHH